MPQLTKAPVPAPKAAAGVAVVQTTPTQMETTIRPMHTADLPAVAALHPTAAAPLLAHVRWCLHTPYATALVLVHANAILGVATVVRFGTSAQVGRFHIHPAHQRQGLGTLLWHAVVAQHTAQHMPILLHCDPRILAFWERQGLVEQCAFSTYANGLFQEATRDEVAIMQPHHTLALLRLDQRATGEDRSMLLMEHHYAGQAYVEGGQVRGVLLPILGNGYIVADAPEVGLELQRWLLPTQHRIAVPELNTPANEHLLDRDYDVVGTTVRIVWGTPPHFDPQLVFAWPW